ncbi:uncharacterized protein IWZ02DRAFT_1395 [Phyllosticta citriasiana]|uniref:uncharacterized protein n=1 Tax=Phyllosticta citriasiana TaxID=595635 RepID=UPI0030FD446D
MRHVTSKMRTPVIHLHEPASSAGAEHVLVLPTYTSPPAVPPGEMPFGWSSTDPLGRRKVKKKSCPVGVEWGERAALCPPGRPHSRHYFHFAGPQDMTWIRCLLAIIFRMMSSPLPLLLVIAITSRQTPPLRPTHVAITNSETLKCLHITTSSRAVKTRPRIVCSAI